MKGGFFALKEAPSSKRLPTGKPASCASCGAYQFVLSPKMEPYGNFKKRILNIGEAPGEDEDKKGRQWQGRAGKRLQKEYAALGVNLFEDCLNINAINCRPVDKAGNNRTPTANEIQCCRQRVLSVIEEYKPNVIVLLGNKPVESIIGNIWTKDLGGISKWRGFAIPDRSLSAWLCPVWHPSYVERQQGFDEIETIWRYDLEWALRYADTPLPIFENEEEQISIIEGGITEQVLRKLMRLKEPFAFDYETTGLKPHSSGHEIICASICFSQNKAYAFPIVGASDAVITLWKELLSDPSIPKIAHNMKFEHQWTHSILGTGVLGWDWDTMLASHILDNRRGICSLKFQTYVNFGVAGYDDDVSSYLKGVDSKNSNSPNKIQELWKQPQGRVKLLTYCGMDSLFTYRLAMKQKGFLV